MRIFFYLSLLFLINLNAKQIDKIALVVNDSVFTQSQIKRIQESIALRKNVSPLVFDKPQFDQKEIAEKLVNKIMIKSKLIQIGYSINDDYVEEQIKANEKKLGVNRSQLIQFLNQQNFNFDEYFETIREAIEYSIFIQRVVSPIISITDQEIKNTYYKRNTKNTRMNFKYGLIDYSINREVNASNDFFKAIQDYKKSNIINEDFKEFSINSLEDISEEDISNELVSILKSTDEGSLSKPIIIDGKLHVFYVAKKDLVESSQYLKEKELIKNELFEKAVIVETNEWFVRERNKHFIKINL